LPEKATVTLTLFDAEGRELAKLIDNRTLQAGTHIVDFVANGYAQGVYLYRLFIDNGIETLIDTKRVAVRV
jgi:hypothetical protein